MNTGLPAPTPVEAARIALRGMHDLQVAANAVGGQLKSPAEVAEVLHLLQQIGEAVPTTVEQMRRWLLGQHLLDQLATTNPTDTARVLAEVAAALELANGAAKATAAALGSASGTAANLVTVPSRAAL